MKLLEFDLKNILVDNYEMSVGHISSNEELNIKNLNDGIIKTIPLSFNDIYHTCKIKIWSTNTNLLKNSFYQYNNKVYICLFAPTTPSVIAPTGNSLHNIILDDNYVWRYIVDVNQVIYDEYVTINKSTFIERIKQGCVSRSEIIVNSNHQISDYSNFYSIGNYLSGVGLNYVVENDQNTHVISDILIQDGGKNYEFGDFLVLTDTDHDINDSAEINVFVENGGVKLESFTNGQNYSYLDVIIIGDGTGASVNYTMIAGVLTNVIITPGSNYTWAKAIIVNSEKHIISRLYTEPLNGYNCDLETHLGPNKYIIETEFNNITDEINFYGLHKKKKENKYVQFEYLFPMSEFVPLIDEIVKARIILVG